MLEMASINHHGELRLIITRYKPWAQCGVSQDVTKLRPDRDAICITRYKPWALCRDSGKTTKRASRQGRDMQNTLQAMGAVP